MWVFHSVFLIHFPILFCMWIKNLGFCRCRSCSSSEATGAPVSVFCCFLFACYLAQQFAGRSSTEAATSWREEGKLWVPALQPLWQEAKTLLPERSAAFWEPFLREGVNKGNIMWLFFQTLKRELLFVLYVASVPWRLAMEREVLASTDGCGTVSTQGKAQTSSLNGRLLEAPWQFWFASV